MIIGPSRGGKSRSISKFEKAINDIERKENTLDVPDLTCPVELAALKIEKSFYLKALKTAIENGWERPEPSAILYAYMSKKFVKPLLTSEASAAGLMRDTKDSTTGVIMITHELSNFFGGAGASARTDAFLQAYRLYAFQEGNNDRW